MAYIDVEMINSVISVVGTILGTVIGFFLSMLYRLGKQRVFLRRIDIIYFYGRDDNGDFVYRKESNYEGRIPQSTNIDIDLLVTNSSEMPFNMNMVKLFIKKRFKSFRSTLYDKNDKKGTSRIYFYQDIKTKQISGKSSVYLELHVTLNDVYIMNKKDIFYIEYIDIKGKKKKKPIKMVDNYETKI